MLSAVIAAASIFQTIVEFLFTLLCGDADRSIVAGERKMVRVYQSAFNGSVKKLLVI